MAAKQEDEEKSAHASNGPLEQFLALANSSRGLAAVQLIKTVLSQPGVFHFGALLEHGNIAALEGTEHEPWLQLLRVFAYGTYPEYEARRAKGEPLPDLGQQQARKLRQLSIVSEASGTKTLGYKALMDLLGVENVRELEDMIIDCIEAGLLFGRLDQKALVFEVDHASGRDIGPGDVGRMIGALTSWLGASERVLAGLEEKMRYADAQHADKVGNDRTVAEQARLVREDILRQKENDAKRRKAAAAEGGGASSSSSSASAAKTD